MTSVRSTTIRWRRVNVSPDTTTHGATCIGSTFEGPCLEPVTWCRNWSTSAMTGLAFWYYCDHHAVGIANADGLRVGALTT